MVASDCETGIQKLFTHETADAVNASTLKGTISTVDVTGRQIKGESHASSGAALACLLCDCIGYNT